MTDDLRTMFDSPYLGAWNVSGKDYNVTIEKVTGADIVGEGGKQSRKPLVYFKGVKKPLIVNKTIMKTLHGLFATYSAKALVGKRITLYATTTKFGGQTVDCIRVRNVAPKAGQDEAPNEQAVPPDGAGREREPGED
jgi:hypothetical protein